MKSERIGMLDGGGVDYGKAIYHNGEPVEDQMCFGGNQQDPGLLFFRA